MSVAVDRLEDTTDAELERLYRERERLQFAEPPTAVRAERVREHRERVEAAIARLEGTRGQ